MTREEAIANLKMISVAFVEPVTKEQRKLIDDTFDMAIKALEQEPKTDEENIHREREQAYMQGYEDACKKYRKEPKTGHWIDDKCSVCGKGIEDLIDSREWYENEKPNYCPFCGVRLVDSQKSEG